MNTLYFIGGAILFTFAVVVVFYTLAGIVVFIGRVVDIEGLPEPGEKLQKASPQKRQTKRNVIYGEPVDGFPKYADERKSNTTALAKPRSGWFENPQEPIEVGDFCVCNHCGAANNWIAGFVCICTNCGRKL